MKSDTNPASGFTVRDLLPVLNGEFEPSIKVTAGGMIVEHGLWREVLEYIDGEKDPKLLFRASWALEWSYFAAGDKFLPHIPFFLEVFFRSTNGSVHRHFTKIICDLLVSGLISEKNADLDVVAEKSFDLLVDPLCKVAVKVWAMDILWHLAPKVEWLRENYKEILQNVLQKDPSPGLENRASKILKRKYKC